MQHLQARVTPGDPPPILTFDKDDVDTLDFVASSANLRSVVFGIDPKSKFDVKRMFRSARTLWTVLTASRDGREHHPRNRDDERHDRRTVCAAGVQGHAAEAGECADGGSAPRASPRRGADEASQVFLVKSTHRVISAERLAAPSLECPACSVAQTRVAVDTSRATLKDLVEDFLRLELGYGDEFSVNNDVGVLYDPDLDDNLEKPLTTLGVRDESFLTIIDEDDDDPRVNLVLSIADTWVIFLANLLLSILSTRVELIIASRDRPLPEPSKPIQASEKVEIGRRPKPTDSSQTQPTTVTVNGDKANGVSNGATPAATLGKRKRAAGSSEGNGDVAPHDDDEDESSRQVKRRDIVPEEDATADVTRSTTGLERSIQTGPVRTSRGSTFVGGGCGLGGNGSGGRDGEGDGDGVIVLDEEEEEEEEEEEKDTAGAITIEDDL